MSIKDRIKFLAKGRINLADLEKELGLSSKSISSWEHHQPKVQSLVAVADYFNVSVDYLLDRESAYTEEETALIAKFRRLTASQRENILNNIDFLLSQNPVKKEAVM